MWLATFLVLAVARARFLPLVKDFELGLPLATGLALHPGARALPLVALVATVIAANAVDRRRARRRVYVGSALLALFVLAGALLAVVVPWVQLIGALR
ncbi:hypothetical protein [Roseimaritima sediminicola]|uniref:hypothetical protein n=1 Tax=Roseimaritima sediminicola TaxID=2662066 RepID=UPI0012982C59|nr:hypothetical protein [Roseimaritima sediminicola]